MVQSSIHLYPSIHVSAGCLVCRELRYYGIRSRGWTPRYTLLVLCWPSLPHLPCAPYHSISVSSPPCSTRVSPSPLASPPPAGICCGIVLVLVYLPPLEREAATRRHLSPQSGTAGQILVSAFPSPRTLPRGEEPPRAPLRGEAVDLR